MFHNLVVNQKDCNGVLVHGVEEGEAGEAGEGEGGVLPT